MSDETYIVARRKHGERVGGQKQGDMLESSGCSVTEGRGKENGAVDCVEDVWLAVQRRRPGVPRRSFGISLTPPLIISLFLCGLSGFVAGLGMHLTSRESGPRIPRTQTKDAVYAYDSARKMRSFNVVYKPPCILLSQDSSFFILTKWIFNINNRRYYIIS